MKYQCPMCIKCKHFFNEKGPLKCKAFPDGIPDEILLNGYNHRKPFKGDHGIQYEEA